MVRMLREGKVGGAAESLACGRRVHHTPPPPEVVGAGSRRDAVLYALMSGRIMYRGGVGKIRAVLS